MYFPTELGGCEMDRCEITAVRDRDVPPELLKRDLSEYGFIIDGWCRKDMPSDFTEYFDLRQCQSRDTGYDGSNVWRFIHHKICFIKKLEDPKHSWKRDYNRAVSGMHAAVSAEIVSEMGPNAAGRAEYHRRLRDLPGVRAAQVPLAPPRLHLPWRRRVHTAAHAAAHLRRAPFQRRRVRGPPSLTSRPQGGPLTVCSPLADSLLTQRYAGSRLASAGSAPRTICARTPLAPRSGAFGCATATSSR
jgi:hypothetical protein